MKAGTEDAAEILAAEIVEAFRETGLRPVVGTGGSLGCACAARALLAASGEVTGCLWTPPASVVPDEHVMCLWNGWDATYSKGTDVGLSHGARCKAPDDDCPYFQAGVLAAHAMSEP